MELTVLLSKANCCISGKPLSTSAGINIIQLPFKAKWKYPVWGNLLTHVNNMACAYVHDDCIVHGKLTGEIKHAIEISNGEIIYHGVDTVVKKCRQCGCSETHACYHEEHGNCWWAEDDLCSHCKLWPGEARKWSTIDLKEMQFQ